jgi:hypothetical protein
MRKIDLTGIPALQGVTGPVTFALEFSDISTGSPEDGNLRLDNIRLDGNAGSEERVTTVNLIL